MEMVLHQIDTENNMETFKLNTCAVCGVPTFEEEDYCIDCLNDISNDYSDHVNDRLNGLFKVISNIEL